MSKNSKNAQRVIAAREMSKTRVAGGRGHRTTPQHGKTKAWWQLFRSHSDYIASLGSRHSN